MIEGVASNKEDEKHIHGKIADKTNKGKYSICIFITELNTKLIAPIIKSGVTAAQAIPKKEPAYLAFNSLSTRFFKICLCEYNLPILFIIFYIA
jgi:hypothetical protein